MNKYAKPCTARKNNEKNGSEINEPQGGMDFKTGMCEQMMRPTECNNDISNVCQQKIKYLSVLLTSATKLFC